MRAFVLAQAAAACAASVVAATQVSAQVEFTARDVFSNVDEVGVFAADLDGDGDNDVIVASRGNSRVMWHENDGAEVPNFTAREVARSISSVRSVFAVDLDDDDDIDVLSASFDDNTIRWYENDGAEDPTFTAHEIFTDATGAVSVFAADVDGDGDIDVLSASQNDNTIRWYESDGAEDPSFTAHTISTSANGARSVFAADVDGDNDIDVLSASANDNAIRWYENDGADDPSFTARDIFTGAAGPRSIFAADLDGDGDTDVASASFGDDAVRWYENDGGADPAFIPHDIAFTTDGTVSIYGADIDADGDTDLLSASQWDNRIKWFENSGGPRPTFTEHIVFIGAGFPTSVSAGDLNGDGVPDVLSTSANDDRTRWYETQFIVRNTTAATVHATIAEAIESASPGDDLLAREDRFEAEPVIDFAGKDLSLRSRDLITQDASGVYALTDDAILAAAPGSDMDLSGQTIAPVGAFTFLAADRFRLRIGADLDMGLASGVFVDAPLGATVESGLDMASNSTLGFSGDLLLPLDPEFTDPNTIFTDADFATSVYAADVDGDGDTDVLSASSGDGTIRWYENDGADAPSFTAREIFANATGAASVFAADVDGDDDIDVLSASFDDNTIRWYENDGAEDPTFTARDVFTTATGATSVFAADVDGDDDIDILSASFGDNTIRWYENDGAEDPTFAARDVFTTASGPVSVFAADVDGDDDIDVLSASRLDNTIRWYENDGAEDPAFTALEISTVGDGARVVFAADVNGDDHIDVLSASSIDNTIRWHENDGADDPSFTTRDIFTDADFATSVYAADLDADGDTDVLSASFDDGTIRWYANDGADVPSFTARAIFSGASGAQSVFAADVDGDGATEVLSASINDSSIRWYDQQTGPTHSVPGGAILSAGGVITNSARMGLFSGTIAADGGLTNRGIMTGLGDIDADVINDRSVTLQGNTNVQGDYTNNGATTIQSGTLTILGTLTNNGEIIGDFAGLDPRGDREGGLFIESDLAFGGDATFRMPSENARLSAGGNVDIAINSNERYDMSLAELRMVALDGAQSLEVMSVDIGTSCTGLDRTIAGHYPIGTLRVGPTSSTVNLVDNHDNANDGQKNREAIYTLDLVIDAGATLNTNGYRVYYETLTLNGEVDEPANLLRIGVSCLTDWDDNCVVKSVDVGAFLTDYFRDQVDGTLLTDFDGNGVVNAADVGAFLSQYFEDIANPLCNGG